MAKPTYAKLKLSTDIAPKELEWGEQKIEIKQYLSIQDKLEFIGDVLNAAADDNRFYSQGKVDMFFAINVIEKYTNLSITDKQKENSIKLYDEIKASGFYDNVDDCTYLITPEAREAVAEFHYQALIKYIQEVIKK